MSDTAKKVIIGVIAVVILGPVILSMWPKPVTFQRIREAFERDGFSVGNVEIIKPPHRESVAQAYMTVNGASVSIYRYDHVGKSAKPAEYLKPDPGSAMVEAWNLSESLGAAKPPPQRTFAARNGMYMLTVTSEKKELRDRIIHVFKNV